MPKKNDLSAIKIKSETTLKSVDAKPAIKPEVTGNDLSIAEIANASVKRTLTGEQKEIRNSKSRGSKSKSEGNGGCSIQIQFNKYEHELLKFVADDESRSLNRQIMNTLIKGLEKEAKRITEDK